MQSFVIIVHLMIVLSMIGFVLLQKSEGGGLGIGGGGGFLSSRGTSNVLSRTTALLAAAFFGTSLILSVLAGMHRGGGSILSGPATQTQGQPTPATGGPLSSSGTGLLDQLRQQEQTPSTPQTPQQ